MNWISVKDELPYDSDYSCENDAVLVYAENPAGPPMISIAQWYKDDGWIIMGNLGAHSCTGFYALTGNEVTHWMPFPPKPRLPSAPE